MPPARRIQIIDTHTGGEPTRVVVGGGPPLGQGSLAERRQRFAERFDHYRTAILSEPRGSEVMVAALLVEPVEPASRCGAIFFNNVGYLGMCGHGLLGVAAALEHLNRLPVGCHAVETPVGTVALEHHGGGKASLENVVSYRHAARVPVTLAGGATVRGDVAYGGNWFFLVDQAEHGQLLTLARAAELTAYCQQIRSALEAQGITGAGGAVIDHIELFAAADSGADSRNFVLCPGGQYDRSPCGTGTSAKLACLAAEGKLAAGEPWIQESLVGSRFEASYRTTPDGIVPRITGTAFVNGEVDLILNEHDPFCWGIRP